MIAAYRTVVTWLDQFPDTPGFFNRHLGARWRQFAVLLVLGLLLRCSTFGDTNLHVDETFYFLVGQEMHHGAIPYVDIWDRKPVGLFLIYWAIAGISTSVVAYQVAAWLFASCTAMVINLIARRWAGTQGGLLAGASYLFMLGPQEGYGGQSPVFYNLLIASAALLVLGARPQLMRGQAGWRVFLAMALAGLALTVKQTTLFEAVFFGLVVAWYLLRSGAPALRSAAIILTCAALGALPTVLTATTYWWIGHWPEFWQAMVTSNLAKAKPDLLIMASGALRMCLRTYPYLALTWLGLCITDRNALDKPDLSILSAWTIAAMIGVLAVPNFYTHYALPLLVPLAITSSVILGRRDVGLFLGALLAVFTMVLYSPFDRAERRMSIDSMEKMAKAIKLHDSGGGLLVFDAPPYLYALADKRPLTPLAFPHHLNHLIERNVSQIDTLQEVRRILHGEPSVVAIGVNPKNIPANRETRAAVKTYVLKNCRIIETQTAYEIGRKNLIAIWGDCRHRIANPAP